MRISWKCLCLFILAPSFVISCLSLFRSFIVHMLSHSFTFLFRSFFSLPSKNAACGVEQGSPWGWAFRWCCSPWAWASSCTAPAKADPEGRPSSGRARSSGGWRRRFQADTCWSVCSVESGFQTKNGKFVKKVDKVRQPNNIFSTFKSCINLTSCNLGTLQIVCNCCQCCWNAV